MLLFVFAAVLLAICNAAWVKEMENPGIYQGDMVLDPDQMKEVAKGTFGFGSIKNGMWPNGEIPYKVDSSLMYEREFNSELQVSIKEYHKYTCLKFVKYQPGRHSGYITFYKGGGCSSPVGYKRRENRVSLSKGCWWRSTIMHEIGHSIGLHHEQSRPDRDDHVTILKHNMVASMYFNFEKEPYSNVDSRGTPYDYWSMMHYTYNAFGKGGATTIKTKDQRYQYEIGQDRGFSPIDALQLQRMYNCKGTYPTPPAFKLTPGCYNLGGGCDSGVFKGRCTRREWKTHMHSKCRKACGLCGGGTVPTGGPQTLPPWTPPTQGPPTKGPPTGCTDRHTNCSTYRSYCSTPSWKAHMSKNCRRTCKLC